MTNFAYSPRGIGQSWQACSVCGHKSSGCQPDMAAFVTSRETGTAIVEMFEKCGMVAVLDYRDYEPNWVQVKLGACDKHVAVLEALVAATGKTRTIDADVIDEALRVGLKDDLQSQAFMKRVKALLP